MTYQQRLFNMALSAWSRVSDGYIFQMKYISQFDFTPLKNSFDLILLEDKDFSFSTVLQKLGNYDT